MRPIPAPRLGDAHGLLRAIHERERLRLDEFLTEFTVEDLFPPGLENALGRTRQFVSFARAAGLLKEDRGTVELTEIGKRYVRAADPERPFGVAPAQAEWLRRLLREKHMTDSIYHGAAVALSLCASTPPDFRASTLDFGRAVSHLGRAGWDNENTFQSQGERYARFLTNMELIDADRRLTPTGQQTRDELTLPIHASLKDLVAQLNPGGLEAAIREGQAEAAAEAAPEPPPAEEAPAAQPAPAEEAPAAQPAPAEEAPAAQPAPAEEAPAAQPARAEEAPAAQPAPAEESPAAEPAAEEPALADDEYQDVGPGAGPSPAAAPPVSAEMPAVASAKPTPPSDVWEVAAPDDRTRAYAAIPEGAPPPAAPAEPARPAEAARTAEAAPTAPAAGAPAAPGDAAPSAVARVEPPGAGVPGVGEPPGSPPAGAATPQAPPVERQAEVAARQPPPAAAPVQPPPAAASAEAPVQPPPAAASAEAPVQPPPAAASAEAPVQPPPEAARAETPHGLGDDQLAGVAAAATVATPTPGVEAPAFLAAAAIRRAAAELGLRLPASVYAAVAAALAGGHVVLLGPPGSGKTTLALAIAKAASQSGRSEGAGVVTAGHRWSARDTVGRPGDEEWEHGVVTDAAARGRWLIVDELDRARLDRALGHLSSFLGGVPVTLPDGETVPPADWRVVATAGTGGLQGSAALVRRFAQVRVPPPSEPDLHVAIDAAAGGDAVAAAAVKRLLGARELGRVGAGAFVAAARFASERNRAEPADESTLAHEALTAYLAPLLPDLDDEGRRRLAALAG
jgi:hypothetical protein